MQDCPCCFAVEGDDIRHVVCCLKISTVYATQWPKIRLPANEAEAVRYFCLQDRPGADEVFKRVIIADLVVKAYQSRRKFRNPANGPSIFIGQAAESRVKHWMAGDDSGKYRAGWETLCAGTWSRGWQT